MITIRTISRTRLRGDTNHHGLNTPDCEPLQPTNVYCRGSLVALVINGVEYCFERSELLRAIDDSNVHDTNMQIERMMSDLKENQA